MSFGLVYILTNPCLDGWVKIGMTERNDIESRLKELNRPSNLPLSYRCYAVYEVDNPYEVEKSIHSLIDIIDLSLHAREVASNGKIREREFFRISPETAYAIFKNVANLRNDKDKLKLYKPTEKDIIEEEIAERKNKRGNNSFELLGIAVGEAITFLFDDNEVATINNSKNEVLYNGEKYSISALARKLLIEKQNWSQNSSANGFRYFTYKGNNLSDLRNKVESEIAND